MTVSRVLYLYILYWKVVCSWFWRARRCEVTNFSCWSLTDSRMLIKQKENKRVSVLSNKESITFLYIHFHRVPSQGGLEYLVCRLDSTSTMTVKVPQHQIRDLLPMVCLSTPNSPTIMIVGHAW